MTFHNKMFEPADGAGLGCPGTEDAGDLHPSCGLLTDLLQRYLSGDLDKDGALQQFSKILDLYPSGDLSDDTAVESARRELRGVPPIDRSFDAKKARAELHGRKLTASRTMGRTLESARANRRAPKYNATQAAAELHGKR